MNKSIFISNNHLPTTFKEKLRVAQFNVFTRSFIRFESVPFEVSPDEFEWIFFTSKRSVDFFLKGVSFSLKNHKIACIGEATANHLNAKGIRVEFYGKNAGNPEEVAKEFLPLLKDNRVFLPLSSKSKKTISNKIPTAQKLECVVYITLLNSVELKGKFEYLVFTSPSNAEGFLQQNRIDAKQTVIAWGNSTRDYLEGKNVIVNHTLDTSSFNELESFLFP
ncbi:MAG: uroporphyrinogen-III synthase [Lishizhenia sp.]